MMKKSVWQVRVTAAVVVLMAGCPLANAQAKGRIPVNKADIRILREIPLSSEIPGILVYVNPTEEGQMVSKGDTIIRLKDDVIQAQYLEATRKAESNVEIEFARVALEKARIDLSVQNEQNSKVVGVPVFTPSEIRQSELEVKKAEAQLQKSTEDKVILELSAATKRTELAQFSIAAPVDGVVTEVARWPGQAVRQGDPILTITDLSTLRAILDVDYSYRDQILVGDEVELIITQERSERRLMAEETSDSAQAGKGGILDNAPGLGRTARGTERNPNPQKAEPAATPRSPSGVTPEPEPGSRRQGERFTGIVTFVAPRLTVSRELEIFVNIPNRKDAEGRYLLQEGVGVTASILRK